MKMKINQTWYSSMYAGDKKHVRSIVEKNMSGRKGQMKYVEDAILSPLKNAVRAGERALKSEIPVNEYVYVEEETSAYLKKVFQEIVVSQRKKRVKKAKKKGGAK
jgi:hypothetical protein